MEKNSIDLYLEENRCGNKWIVLENGISILEENGYSHYYYGKMSIQLLRFNKKILISQ